MDKKKLFQRTALLFIAASLLSAAKEKTKLIDPFIEKLQQQLLNFRNHHQEEKVYLQLDKNFYKPGEQIWFSGWIRSADDLLAEDVSEMLYVELINPKGAVIEQQPLIASEGNVNGALHLPQDIGGLYKVKAYTKWQKNTKTFFEKDIQVQAVVFPNLIMKLDFERKAYGPGATVTAQLEAKDLDDEVLRLREYSYIVSVAGKKILKGKSTFDFDGKTDLVFDLPEDLETTDGLLQVLIPNKGQTESISRAIPITLNDIDLQFFPEGGQFIAGLSSKVAFKALNEFGKPADVEGVILNNKGEEVASFNSYHMGMGATRLWPERGNEYRAKITKPAGITKVYKLPEVILRGINLGVAAQTEQSIKVEVQATRSQSFKLIAQSADRILFSEEARVKGLSTIDIPTTDFPMGITRLTLFDEHDNIAAERLVFVNPHKQLTIEIKTDKQQYSPREKVKMDISIKDHEGNPVVGNFALSVADQKILTFAHDKQGHILSKLFLESELKGKIEEPDFYFDKEQEKAIAALDHLMMTQGWRRYDWKAIQNEEWIAMKELKERCSIAGQIVDGNDKPVPNAKVSIASRSLETTSDHEGFFEIKNLKLQRQGVLMSIESEGFPTIRKSIVGYKSDYKIIMANEVGSLSGTLLKPDDNAAYNASITLQNDNGNQWTFYADKEGAYSLSHLKPGDYTLKFKWSNLPVYQIEKVMIWPSEHLSISRKFFTKENAPTGTIENMNAKKHELANTKVLVKKLEKVTERQSASQSMASYGEVVGTGGGAVSLDQICVLDYKVPLVEQDNTTQGSIVTGHDIQKFATKSIASIAAATAGMSQVDEGDGITVRGSRSSATAIYVDGIRVSASLVNDSDIEQLQVITSGFPAYVGGGVSYVPERRWVGVDKNKKEEAIFHFREPSEVLGSDFGFVSSGGGGSRGASYSTRSRRNKNTIRRPKDLFVQVDQPASPIIKGCKGDCTTTGTSLCDKHNLSKIIEEEVEKWKSKYSAYVDCTIEYFINKKGEMGGLHISNASYGYYLRKALDQRLKKIKQWKPATLNGKKVASKIVIPVASKLTPSRLKTNYIKSPEFYAPQYMTNEPVVKRTDFRSTIYWNPDLQTNENGEVTVEFWNADGLTTLEARVEGFSNNGLTGEATHTYAVQMPFSLSAKMPVILLEGDEVSVPITLSNNTDEAISGDLSMVIPPCFKSTANKNSTYHLKARESITVHSLFKLVNDSKSKSVKRAPILFSFKADNLQDQFSQLIRFQSDGFPISEVFTGTDSNNTFTININKHRPGTIKTQLKAHTNIVSDIMATTERMLRQPSGCFEQTSSSNYPNVLVMQYLKKHKEQPNLTVMNKAEGYLESGYKRLTGYEVRGGGFDWFGKGPAHEALTAYGILQFTDMAKVYPVEQAMLERSVKWLLTRRDKKGGWIPGKRGLHSWAATPEIRNAYINWALAEAGHGSKIQKEINASYDVALDTDDPYIIALVANTLSAAKDGRAKKLIKKLTKMQNTDGSFAGKQYTIVNSRGKVQSLETTALAALALLQGDLDTRKVASKAVQFIANSKSSYGFGSTQSTVLCIKALMAFAEQSSGELKEGNMALLVNGLLIEEVPYSTRQSRELNFQDFSHLLKEGEQKVEILFKDKGEPIPFDLLIDYSSALPAQSGNMCKLQLTTNLSEAVIPQGETTRLTTQLVNQAEEVVTSPIAIVGIPSGLSPQPWQLKKLQEEEVIAYYEIVDNKVIFYLRELAAKATKEIHLDLKADVPGRYLSPASKAYLYYENDAVSWVGGTEVVVN